MIVVKNKSKSINLNFIEISEFIKKIDFNNFLSMSVCKIAISQVTSQKKMQGSFKEDCKAKQLS